MRKFAKKLFEYIGNVGVAFIATGAISGFFEQVVTAMAFKISAVGVVFIVLASLITKEWDMNILDMVLLMMLVVAAVGVVMYYFPFSKNKQHDHKHTA